MSSPILQTLQIGTIIPLKQQPYLETYKLPVDRCNWLVETYHIVVSFAYHLEEKRGERC